jgi:hypothetical protein
MAFEWGAHFVALDGSEVVFDIFDQYLRIVCPDMPALASVKTRLGAFEDMILPANYFKGDSSNAEN